MSEAGTNWRDFYSDYSTLELIKALQRVRREKDSAEEELKAINEEHEYLAKTALPDKFTEEGIKNMVVEGVGRVGLQPDLYASIKAGQKEEALQWLSDIGAGDLIQDSVAPSTLKAFLKTRLKSAQDIPEELFNVTPFQRASITKGA